MDIKDIEERIGVMIHFVSSCSSSSSSSEKTGCLKKCSLGTRCNGESRRKSSKQTEQDNIGKEEELEKDDDEPEKEEELEEDDEELEQEEELEKEEEEEEELEKEEEEGTTSI